MMMPELRFHPPPERSAILLPEMLADNSEASPDFTDQAYPGQQQSPVRWHPASELLAHQELSVQIRK